MKTLGLTGGIACGKSTVAAILRSLNVPVIDADDVARQVVQPGMPALAEIVDAFGEGILHADGTLNRSALGALVMGDTPEHRGRRDTLNAITHPRIAQTTLLQLKALADQGHVLAGVEAALMIESGSYQMYDLLVVVTCRPEVQRDRLCARQNIPPEQAQKWIASQMPAAEKAALADVVITNNADHQALQAATTAALQQIRQRLALL